MEGEMERKRKWELGTEKIEWFQEQKWRIEQIENDNK